MKDEILEFIQMIVVLVIGYTIIFMIGSWLSNSRPEPKYDGWSPGAYDYTQP